MSSGTTTSHRSLHRPLLYSGVDLLASHAAMASTSAPVGALGIVRWLRRDNLPTRTPPGVLKPQADGLVDGERIAGLQLPDGVRHPVAAGPARERQVDVAEGQSPANLRRFLFMGACMLRRFPEQDGVVPASDLKRGLPLPESIRVRVWRVLVMAT